MNIDMTISESVHSIGQLLIIVEYCSKGNLLEHLRSKRHTLSPLSVKDQLHMCLQVSRGMEHLAYMKVQHFFNSVTLIDCCIFTIIVCTS